MRRDPGLRSVPQTASRIVVACAITPQQGARLADSLRGRAQIRLIASFDELTRMLRATIEAIDVVVLPPRDSSGAEAERTIHMIVTERPGVAVVAYCQAGLHHSTDIRALAAAGVHQFVFSGIDDSGVTFRAVLDAARRQCAAEWVMQQLAPVVPPALHPMVEVMLARADAITTIGDLAGALGVRRRTLFNRCERAGFLPPAELLAWVRLALVAHLMTTTGCTIETIAIELSYASDTSLRNTMKRYTGRRASEVRERGGVQCVVQALTERLRSNDNLPEKLHAM